MIHGKVHSVLLAFSWILRSNIFTGWYFELRRQCYFSETVNILLLLMLGEKWKTVQNQTAVCWNQTQLSRFSRGGGVSEGLCWGKLATEVMSFLNFCSSVRRAACWGRQSSSSCGQLMKEKSKSAKISCCSAVRTQGVRGSVRTGLRRVNSSSKLLTSCGARMTGRNGGFTFLARRASQSISCKHTTGAVSLKVPWGRAVVSLTLNSLTKGISSWFKLYW